MPDDEIKQHEEQIQKAIAESISKGLNIPVYVVNSDSINQVFEKVKEQLPNIEKKYSPEGLYAEVSAFVSKFAVFRPKSNEEANKRVEEFIASLKKEKNYEASILIPGLIGFPIGIKIGSLEIIEQIPADSDLDNFLKFQEKEKHFSTQNCLHSKIAFKAYTSVNVTDILFKILELPMAILSLISGLDLDVMNCAGIVKSPDISTTFFLEPRSKINGWSRYDADVFGNYFNILSKVSLDKKPNQLKKKILQAIQVFGLSRLTRKPEIRFLLLISSFESLLLTESDRDYLGKKLSEKTAFLLEAEYAKRLELYKLINKFYGKRSGLVHRGEIDITENDVRTLEYLFRDLVFRILELSKDYDKMDQKSNEKDKEGIEDYLNKLKFS